MTRDKAIDIVKRSFDSSIPWDGNLVDALAALGLLKLDTPASMHEEGLAFITSMLHQWDNSLTPGQSIKADMALAGFKIVRDK